MTAAGGGTRKVLIVEDDQAMAVALRDGFTYEGYAVHVARDGAAGLRMAEERSHDLVILDVMLPRMSGLDVCRQLRSAGNDTPIIMLTARGQEIDKVLGLKTGADDYVTKPFSFLELMARVEAVLRRTSKFTESVDNVGFGDVEMNFKTFEATKGGRALELSPREFKMMKYFVEHRGEVVTRDQLLDHVWGYEGLPLTRTVDMHIAKLRQKIEDTPSDPRHVITVHRVGYKFTG
ncbi:MAG TPA: response regulator transcription factor [Pyrinomonadaceae bacterium]|jgi:two-component system alkaline phosphatase synthesis response regulator PhoP|nr:response regulator transcription factor [Pyrinomonadaceae bacterium]